MAYTSYLDSRISSFLRLLSEETLTVLTQIVLDDEQICGVTDISSLSLLAMLTRVRQPIRFLQLGTHYGYTALVLSDIMKHNIHRGRLYTVELRAECHVVARQHAARAGLGDSIEFIDGASTDEHVIQTVRDNGPYDMIYIDSSHSYGETLKELEHYIENPAIVSDSTLVFFHDASEFARQYDATGEGGVRAALDEWHEKHRRDFRVHIFEPPSWPNACGFGMLSRKPAPLPPETSTPGARDGR
jgi:predicted O-methyltransferase YrrM